MKINWSKVTSIFNVLKYITAAEISDKDALIINRTHNQGPNNLSEQFKLPWSAMRTAIEEEAVVALSDPTNLTFSATDPLFITDTITAGNRTINYSYTPYTAPTIYLTGNQTVETGSLVTGSWTGTFVSGREAIISRLVTDLGEGGDAIPGDLTIPFNLTSTGTTSSVRGVVDVFDLDVSDGTTPVTTNASITFYAKVYQFYSSKTGLTGDEILEADILNATGSETVSSSVVTALGGTNAYVIPSNGDYIYWAYETGTTEITSISEGPIPVPIENNIANIANVTIINAQGATVELRLVRTFNPLSAATKNLTLV